MPPGESQAALAPQNWFQADKLKIIMTIQLLAVSVSTILCGIVSALVTDFLQSIVMNVGLITVTIWISPRSQHSFPRRNARNS